jgi:enolase
MKAGLLAFGICVFFTGIANAQAIKPEEIGTLVSDTERAVAVYEPVIATLSQDPQFSPYLDSDKATLETLKKSIAKLKDHPERYEASVAFALDTALSDAARNTALCSGQALAFSSEAEHTGRKERAKTYYQLSMTCLNASSMVYTVSEKSGDLTLRAIQVTEDALKLLVAKRMSKH